MKWTKTKSYSELFGSKILDVKTMNDAVERMYSDPKLFDEFYANLRSFSPAAKDCDTIRCHNITLCTINYTLYDDVHACYKKYGY